MQASNITTKLLYTMQLKVKQLISGATRRSRLLWKPRKAHSLISSRDDCCNSVLSGITSVIARRLQSVRSAPSTVAVRLPDISRQLLYIYASLSRAMVLPCEVTELRTGTCRFEPKSFHVSGARLCRYVWNSLSALSLDRYVTNKLKTHALVV